MQHLQSLVLTLGIVLWALPGLGESPALSAEDVVAVKAANQGYVTAWLANDPAAVMSTRFWDGEIHSYGSLRAMYHEGQIGSVVTMDAMLPDPDLYAVGALAGLDGEITVIAGDVYLSYPDGSATTKVERTDWSDAEATLLVAARVPAWISFSIKDPIRFEDLDEAIAELAASAGMNAHDRFPFLLEGEFEDLQIHVIDGSRLTEGGASHEDHLEASTRISADHATATLVGFYSTRDQGVFTHRESTTHIHCVLGKPLAAGHLDHVVIPAGAKAKFPVLGP
jgi:acetolactate decarboxylase